MTVWRRALFGVLLFAGCAAADAPLDAGWAGTLDTLPGGAVLVSNPAEGIWADAPRRIIEEVRIGAVDGTGPDVFGEITAVAVGPRGWLYVLDGQAQEIRVITREGRYVRTIGRSGEGPGEFGYAFVLGRDAEDRLWVVDRGNARYSVFDSAGGYLESHPRDLGMVAPWLGGFDAAGRLYDVSPRALPDGTARYTYYRSSDALEVRDSFPPLIYERPERPVPTLRGPRPHRGR